MSASLTSRAHFPSFPAINFELDLPEKEWRHKLRDIALKQQKNAFMAARAISRACFIVMIGMSLLNEEDDLPAIFFILRWVIRASMLLSFGLSLLLKVIKPFEADLSPIYIGLLERVAASVGLNPATLASGQFEHADPAYEASLCALDLSCGAGEEDDLRDHITLTFFRYPIEVRYLRGTEVASAAIDLLPALQWLKSKNRLALKTGENIAVFDVVDVKFNHGIIGRIQQKIAALDPAPAALALVIGDTSTSGGVRHRGPAALVDAIP